jgi:uncharacterized protein
MEHCRVEFRSGRDVLVGTLTLPHGKGRAPCVVTASGFGGVKEMLLPAFAESLAGAGIASLAFDYAGFGESGGERRQHVDPAAQRRAYVDALDFLSADARVDPERLGAWGPSFAGAHTLHAAATDPRVRCAVAIVPFVRPPYRPDLRLVREVVVELIRGALGRPGETIPAAGAPGTRAVMNSDGAADWLAGVTRNAPNFRNEVTVASLWEVARYRAVKPLRNVRVPVRLVLATRDSITPASSVHAVLRGRDMANIDVVEFPETHFELLTTHLEEVVASTTDWFARHLGSTLSAGRAPEAAART